MSEGLIAWQAAVLLMQHAQYVSTTPASTCSMLLAAHPWAQKDRCRRCQASVGGRDKSGDAVAVPGYCEQHILRFSIYPDSDIICRCREKAPQYVADLVDACKALAIERPTAGGPFLCPL